MILCDRKTAELMISESLSTEDTDRFEEHVAKCPKCQKLLMEVAGGTEVLSAASSLLSSSMEMPQWSDQPTSLLSVSGGEALNSNRIEHSVDLSVLGPTDDPASMGRIGNYEIQGIIGRGGMGIVFRAIDSALSRNVALKVLDPSLASVAAARKRFAMEARAMAAISHEHVVPVYTVDEHRGLPYFAMEYVPGGTLESRIRKQGPLDVLSILRIARQIALALSAAHECGLVHRDIKPANILLDRGVERVRVADFGLARVNSDASHTRSGFIAGTPQFMAPEQVRGETCTARSDLFSLGTVMYAMCTGHSPFRSESIYGSMQRIVHETPRSIREQAPMVPNWLEAFIFKLLSKAEANRFADAVTVANLLEREIAHFENPNQHSKPPRSEYGYESQATLKSLSAKRILVSLACLLCVGLWIAIQWIPKQTVNNDSVGIGAQGSLRDASADSTSQRIQTFLNQADQTEYRLQEESKTIREQSTRLLQSFMGSEELPIHDTFDLELRRLKSALDAFEHQNR